MPEVPLTIEEIRTGVRWGVIDGVTTLGELSRAVDLTGRYA